MGPTSWATDISGAVYFLLLVGIHWLGFGWYGAMAIGFVLGTLAWLAVNKFETEWAEQQKTLIRHARRKAFHESMRDFNHDK